MWWVILIGLAFRVFPRERPPAIALVAGGCLAGLTAFTGLSVLWASDDGRAFDELLRAIGYLGLFVLVLLTSGKRTGSGWLHGLAFGIFAVAIVALGSRFYPSTFSDPTLDAALQETRGRLSYPVGYWNALGALLAVGTVLLLWLGASARTVLRRSLATAAVPLTVLALVLTSSRGAAVALAVGIAALGAFVPERLRLVASLVTAGLGSALLVAFALAREVFVDAQTRAPEYASQADDVRLVAFLTVAFVLILRARVDNGVERTRVPRRLSIALGAIAVLGALVALIASNPFERVERLTEPPDPQESFEEQGLVARHLTSGEGTGRYQFWEAGWEAFKSEPLIGVGAGGYEAWWSEHGTLEYFVRNAHSLVLETAAELGIVGLLLVLGFLGAGALAGVGSRNGLVWEQPQAAALAVLACGVTAAAIEWTWEVPGTFAPVVVAVAVLTGPALRAAGDAGVSLRPWKLGVAVAGCAGILIGGVALIGDRALHDSREAAGEGDYARAADDARRARSIQPWAAEPHLQLALLAERTKDLTTANREVDEALERAPDDWRAWVVALRLRTKADDAPAARVALARARELAPRVGALKRLGPRNLNQ